MAVADSGQKWLETRDPATHTGDGDQDWYRRYQAADGQLYAVLLSAYFFLTMFPAMLDTPNSSRNRGSDGPRPYRNQVYVHSVTIAAAEVASGRSMPSGSGVVAGGSAGSAMGSSSGCRVSFGTGWGRLLFEPRRACPRPSGSRGSPLPKLEPSIADDGRLANYRAVSPAGMGWGRVAVSLIVAVGLAAALGFGRQVAGAGSARHPGRRPRGTACRAPFGAQRVPDGFLEFRSARRRPAPAFGHRLG